MCFNICCTGNSRILPALFLGALCSFLTLLAVCVSLSRSVPPLIYSLQRASISLSMKELWVPLSSTVMMPSVEDTSLDVERVSGSNFDCGSFAMRSDTVISGVILSTNLCCQELKCHLRWIFL